MANNNIIAMDSLKEEALRLYTGMIDVFPQFSQETTLDISKLAAFDGCYSCNNSTICFVSNNEVYVIPYTPIVLNSLRYASFRQEKFYVPFSNGDYPKCEQAKWESICEKAHQSRVEDLTERCASYCEEHQIGTITGVALRNYFRSQLA